MKKLTPIESEMAFMAELKLKYGNHNAQEEKPMKMIDQQTLDRIEKLEILITEKSPTILYAHIAELKKKIQELEYKLKISTEIRAMDIKLSGMALLHSRCAACEYSVEVK